MELPFVTVDVFSTTRYRGNPLAIVTIPCSAKPPTQSQKLAIAREFNLSETVFVHDVSPTSPSTARKIDIFLTAGETPFAGHPTIGAAMFLLPAGVTTLVTKAGTIPIAKVDEQAVSAKIPHDLRQHARTARDLPASVVETLLSPYLDIKERELTAPCFSIVNGVTLMLIELPSLEALSRAAPMQDALPAEAILDQGWRTGLVKKYYFVRMRHDNPDSSQGQGFNSQTKAAVELRTRMMASRREDPGTGSAACALSAYLCLNSASPGSGSTWTRRYHITQGVEMGKDSSITVDVSISDGRVETIHLIGAAVQVMHGQIKV